MNLKLFFFSIKNAFRRKGILLIALIGTGLGTALMATLVSLSNGMDAELSRTLNLVATDITVTAADTLSFSAIFGGGTPIPSNYADEMLLINGVSSVQPIVTTLIPSSVISSNNPVGSTLTGVDLSIDKEVSGPTTKIISGETLSNEYDIIVGSDFLNRPMAENDLKIGDVLSIPIVSDLSTQDSTSSQTTLTQPLMPFTQGGSQDADPQAIPPNVETIQFTLVGIFETGNSFDDGGFIASIDDVRELAMISDDQVTSFNVVAENTEVVEEVAAEIEKTFENESIPVNTTLSKDVLGELNDTLSIFQTFILVISLVAAVAGGMSIFIIMLMSVIERLQEFGIFKATGWSNTNIILSVIIESITVAILGSFVGLSFGYIVGRLINREIGTEIALFDMQLVISILLFGIFMGVLGGVLPAIKAARVSPIETLQSV